MIRSHKGPLKGRHRPDSGRPPSNDAHFDRRAGHGGGHHIYSASVFCGLPSIVCSFWPFGRSFASITPAKGTRS